MCLTQTENELAVNNCYKKCDILTNEYKELSNKYKELSNKYNELADKFNLLNVVLKLYICFTIILVVIVLLK